MKRNNGMRCSCGAMASPGKTNIDGYTVRCWKCQKCQQEYLDSGDAEFVLLAKKLAHKPLTAKIGTLGNSYILRIPKEIAELLRLTKGKRATLRLGGKNDLIVSMD